MDALFQSVILVTAAEMGDKTQLLALVLALRFKKPWTIMAGILVATLLNHALAAWVGGWAAGLFSANTLTYVLAATFAAFAVWILIPDKEDGAERMAGYGAFLTTVVTFFLAEMGDKTQLATLALGAKYQHPIMVTAGTTMGMLIADGLAVAFGQKLIQRIPMSYVRLAAALIFLGTAIMMLLSLPAVQALDTTILQALRQDVPPFDPIGPAWLRDVMRDITALGGYAVLIVLVVLSALYLRIIGRRRDAVSLVVAAVTGNWLSDLLKNFFARARPSVVPHLQDIPATSYSFPSGHSMVSAVIYLTCAAILARSAATRAVRVYLIGAAAFLTALIGISRLYLGVHYPSDVLGGWVIGIVWASICWLVCQRLGQPAPQKVKL